MCGIFGYYGINLPAEESLLKALNSLRHRGPDQFGFYSDCETERKIWLGHRRLSILDLSEAGKQPFITPDKKVAVAVNGEIYNVNELRPALEAKGAVFQSHSDSEILLWGFYFEGENFFCKMRGMFAAAIWDRRNFEPRLILLRDRQGIKPMHYRIHDGEIAFASELKAIKALPDFTEKIDDFALDHYFAMRYIPAPMTVYENTYKVRPGEYVVFEGGKVRHEFWWKIQVPGNKFSGSVADAEKELDHLLNESVREQLMADVPLGAFLSGGIDSSLICAIARKYTKLKTYTIGFDTVREDESKFAGEIAAFLGTEHHCRIMNADDLFRVLPAIPEMYDEPYADPSALPTALLSKFAREQVTTVLSGDGGDELFFGYNNLRSLQKIARLDSFLPGPLRIFCMEAAGKLSLKSRLGRIGKGLAYRGFDEAYLLISGVFHRICFDRLTGRRFEIEKSVFRTAYQELRKQIPEKFLAPFFDQTFYMPDDVLCKVDRATMAYALEARPPILDHRIVEFANSLPHEFKYGPNGGKLILKKVLAKYVPETLWNRPKQGFSPPVGKWFRNELKAEVCDLLSESALKKEGRFNPAFVQSLLKEHFSGKKDNGYYLWTLFCWEKWCLQ